LVLRRQRDADGPQRAEQRHREHLVGSSVVAADAPLLGFVALAAVAKADLQRQLARRVQMWR
jgi:hypothetical protein